MRSHGLLILLVLFILGTEVTRAHNQIYCGRKLAIAIADVCERRGQNMTKKSQSQYNAISIDNEWPWLRHFKLHSDRVNRYKRLIGVASECCERPCSEDVLASYCGI